jgi:1A family penicillin-binding protein
MASSLARAGERFRGWLEPTTDQARTVHRKPLLAAVGALSLLSVVLAVWTIRYAVAINRLGQGVGDTVFLGTDGKPWFRLDEHRHDVPLADIAPALRHAVVAVEDHRFYSHLGVDPIAVGRAVFHNLRERSLVEGGSTLTQQLARTLFLSNARTAGRKAKEAALALMIERRLRKDQILELYLNRVYMGAGRYGADSMSQAVFGKPAKSLSIAEAAYLAGLIRAPTALSPWSNPQGALERSHTVLRRMREERYITPDEEDAARHARLQIVSVPPSVVDAKGGYAKEYLRDEFRERFGKGHPPGWTVHTTFEPALQEMAESAVAEGLRTLRIPGLQAALVALDPRTGDLLALVGGSDALASPYNRAVRSRRQPGSTFKPIVYAAALDRGMSPVSVLHDLRTVSLVSQDHEWSPGGVHESPEAETLRQALTESNNQAAVSLQQRIGSRAVLGLARDLGLSDMPDVPSLALGTGLVTPLELTAAYASFANGGFAVQPRGILEVFDADGDQAYEAELRRNRVLPDTVAFQVLTMLRDVVDRGTGAPVRQRRVQFPVAGKTGTTDDFKDAWFVGFSSSVVVGVWVGFDQPSTIVSEGYGARVALPIWAEFMRRAAVLRVPMEFEAPSGLEPVELCQQSYLRAVAECPTYIEYFKEGDEIPRGTCPIHHGDFKQMARRKLGRFFAGFGRKLKSIFED